jgi:hypothetical protein
MSKKLSAAKTISHRFAQQSADPSAPAASFWNLFYKSLGMFVQAPGSATAYFVGGARREIMVYAKDMWPSNANGADALAQTEFVTNKQNIKSIDFPNGVADDTVTDPNAEFTIIMPETWVVGGDLTAQFYWTAAGGSVGETVAWALQARSYGDGSAIDAAWGTAVVTSDTLLATDQLHRSAESTDVTPSSTLSGGRLVHFRVYRDVSADNLAADAKLIAIRLFHF